MVDQATRYQRLTDHGQSALATVTAVRATGERFGGDPELELELDVEVGGERRELRIRQVVSRLAAPELGVGLVLLVQLDPADPTQAAVA